MARVFELSKPGPAERRPLRSVDRLDLDPGAGEISIDVAACAVCRTDLQLIEGDLKARTLPIVPGHQVVGRVRAVGDGVERWQPGARVGVAWLGGACGQCDLCRSGRENLCERAEFTGWDRDGGYAETMTARADFVFSVSTRVHRHRSCTAALWRDHRLPVAQAVRHQAGRTAGVVRVWGVCAARLPGSPALGLRDLCGNQVKGGARAGARDGCGLGRVLP